MVDFSRNYVKPKKIYRLILGILFVTSKQSKALSHCSMRSPEAYLMDSLNSIFLKSRPTFNGKIQILNMI